MKVWFYITLSVALAFIFELAGIPVASNLLSYVGISTTGFTIKTAAFYLAIFGGAGILIGIIGGLTVGYLTKSPPENFIILPFIVSGATLFLTTFYGIANYASTNYSGTWVEYITLFLVGILSIGFVVSLVEFFRGTD